MRYLLTLIAALSFQISFGQNLVPNYSFENYNNCPTHFSSQSNWALQFSPTYSDFPTVTDWINPTYYSTTDYFNACAVYTDFVNVPNTRGGYQQAKTGNAFIGIVAYNNQDTTYSEYAETKLLQPMIAGHKYYASFFINLGTRDSNLPGSGLSWNRKIIALDSISMHFSDTLVQDSVNHLSFISHIASPGGSFITDTVGWQKISGVYTASGNEQWLTIGKSYSNSIPPHIFIPPVTGNPNGLAYYFIDDVCVLDMSYPSAFNAADTIYTSTFPINIQGQNTGTGYYWNTGDTSLVIAVNNPGTYTRGAFGDCIYIVDTIVVIDPTTIHTLYPMNARLFPNPFTIATILTIHNPQHKTHVLSVYNIEGRLMRRIDNITGNEIRIERGELSAGCYFYELRSEDGANVKGKLFVE